MDGILIDKQLKIVWTHVPDPIRKDDEVLIEVHAATVNRADLMQVDGNDESTLGWTE